MNRFLDYVPPIYRATVIETGIYPSLILNDITDIVEDREVQLGRWRG
jgi:hypothetical protein